jgi:putative MATE family efflux protein
MTEKKKIRLIGNKAFYRMVFKVTIPIIIQNLITSFVSLLDNIMVGQVGTESMSGVAIANQLMFIFNLAIFGAFSGIGIFTAQFAGKHDQKGLTYTVRLKLAMVLLLTFLGVMVFFNSGDSLIRLWLNGSNSMDDSIATLTAAHQYMLTMLVGLLPFALAQVYSSTLRETGETMIPMMAGLTAIVVNLIGNYILIYGKFGAPQLGVVGAAAATVLSRFVEAAFVILWSHRHARRFPFMKDVFRSFYVPRQLAASILLKSFPLLLNETLWSLGQAALSQQYSTLSLSVIAAFNISSTIANVFNVAFISMGDATAIILGQKLGQLGTTGDKNAVKHDAYRLAVISVVLCIISGSLMALTSLFFPQVYNTTAEIKHTASTLILVSACYMPVHAYMNASYFTLRSGGKTWITFLFDSVFVWVCSIPAAYIFTHYTSMTIVPVYISVLSLDFIKCIIGFLLVRNGNWIHDLTEYVA